MGKKILIMVSLILGLALYPTSIYAQAEAGSSAVMKNSLLSAPNLKMELNSPSYNLKKLTIKKVLAKYGSPMGDEEIDAFMKQAQEHGLNYYLLPSITGVESGFCRQTAPGSNNCFGWGGGYIVFNDVSDGITTVATGLDKNYIHKGATSIEAIGKIYAANPEWPARVQHWMSVFEAEEEKNQLFFAQNTVQ